MEPGWLILNTELLLLINPPQGQLIQADHMEWLILDIQELVQIDKHHHINKVDQLVDQEFIKVDPKVDIEGKLIQAFQVQVPFDLEQLEQLVINLAQLVINQEQLDTNQELLEQLVTNLAQLVINLEQLDTNLAQLDTNQGLLVTNLVLLVLLREHTNPAPLEQLELKANLDSNQHMATNNKDQVDHLKAEHWVLHTSIEEDLIPDKEETTEKTYDFLNYYYKFIY